VKLVHLFGFIIKKFVTMHGHVHVKFIRDVYLACVCNLGTQIVHVFVNFVIAIKVTSEYKFVHKLP
jgi:hypothetical protein